MRVFITGASGWIGTAATAELLAAGHQVTGLARSEASAAAIAAAGAGVERGTLDDLDLLRKAAAEADAVVHLAFKHDIAFAGEFDRAVADDRRVVEAFGEALEGTGKFFAMVSGTPLTGGTATEEDGHDVPADAAGPAGRSATAEYALGLAGRGVRSAVLRVPIVYGEGDPGFLAVLAGIARDLGVSGYVGDGANRWSTVHVADAGRLVRLAVERAPAGSTLHVVGETGVPTRDIAAAVGRGLGVPVASVAPAEAGTHFGWLGEFFAADRAADSARTRELLGWEPVGHGLIEDLDRGHYFA